MSVKSLILTICTLAIVGYCIILGVYQAADKIDTYFSSRYDQAHTINSTEDTSYGK